MSRQKMKEEDKKVTFGITIHPELHKLIKQEANDKNIPVSQIVEKVMKTYLENKKD